MLFGFALSADTIFLVAEESGVIQGYIGMHLAADEGEITNVAVNPAPGVESGEGCSQR